MSELLELAQDEIDRLRAFNHALQISNTQLLLENRALKVLALDCVVCRDVLNDTLMLAAQQANSSKT